MADVADVVAISTVPDAAEIQRRLTNAERAVFARHERKFLQVMKKAWRDWNYEKFGPQYRNPTKHPWNVSLQEWRTTIETTSAGHLVLNLINDSDYASFVHRTGTPVIEWERIWDGVQVALIPALVADMQAAMEAAINEPVAPKKLGPRGGSTTVRASAKVI